MRREQVRKLHYITHVENLDSILSNGILSHERARSVPHRSVALQEVQNLRAKVWLPNVRRLHTHVNLYFDARNPMMYYLREMHDQLVVIEISPEVMDIPGTWISDGNSAIPRATTFYPPTEKGFSKLCEKFIYADSWHDPDPSVMGELRRRRCAEVLVPEEVRTDYLIGVCCSCQSALEGIRVKGYNMNMDLSERMFFR